MTSDLRIFLAYTEPELDRYYSHAALDVLREHAAVVRNETGAVLAGTALARAAEGCDIVIAHRSVAVDETAFAAMPRLLAMLRCAMDVSTIDVASASAHGVLVTRTTRGFERAVAELGIGLMFDLARGISRADHGYKTSVPFIPGQAGQLLDATVGIVGYGQIAEPLAEMAHGIGMKVVAFDPHASAERLGDKARPLDLLLESSDFVVCLAASTPQTAGMFGHEAFGRMKPGSFFINLARGELVDEVALERALDAGRLAGAGLDVGSAADQMPGKRLAARSDVVATPHIGGMTVAARAHQAMDTARQVVAIAGGHMPEGAVNPESAARLIARFRHL